MGLVGETAGAASFFYHLCTLCSLDSKIVGLVGETAGAASFFYHLCTLCSLDSKICEPYRDTLGGIRVKQVINFKPRTIGHQIQITFLKKR